MSGYTTTINDGVVLAPDGRIIVVIPVSSVNFALAEMTVAILNEMKIMIDEALEARR